MAHVQLFSSYKIAEGDWTSFSFFVVVGSKTGKLSCPFCVDSIFGAQSPNDLHNLTHCNGLFAKKFWNHLRFV